MKDEILKETLRQAFRQSDRSISISWQGGEPTLMGLSFYKRVVQLEKAFGKGKVVGNAFQTNGILLNVKWARFFKKYKFLVGISIDGPEHVHDHYRRTANNSGTWAKVYRNTKMLLFEGVSVNALTCLTDKSVHFPEQIYAFHKAMGLRFMQFIPIVDCDSCQNRGIVPYSVAPEHYGEFLCRVFDLWLADFKGGRPTTSVRLFESVLFSCLGETAPQCTFRNRCGEYLVVEHNGDVYACDFFVEHRWKLGNVMHGRLNEMLNSEKQRQFGNLKTQLPGKCRRCKYLRHCHGGCTKDRNLRVGSAGHNYFCLAYRRFFDYALPVFKKMVL